MAKRWLIGLALAACVSAHAQPRQVEDPLYGESLFHYYQDDYFTGLTHLMAAQASNRLTKDWDEGELLLGSLKLSYGLTDAAEAIFRRLLSREPSESVRNRAWYYLAQIAFEKGRLDQAAAALAEMSRDLPPELRGKRQLLEALVLMQQGDFANAAKVLHPWQGLAKDAPFARYNLGIALVRSNQLEAGAKILDELGRARARGEEAGSLRDKANLALARALLEVDPDGAKKALARVRLQGPMSNKALLGAGWADVVAQRYEHALLPWGELTQRPVSDPAVQEAMLALPYALMQLKARDQAAEMYRSAIDALTGEVGRLEAAMAAVERGELLAVALKIDPRTDELPPVEQIPGRRYLGELIASHGFRRALQDYQDIEALQANVAYWEDRLGLYREMLAASRSRHDARLAQLQRRLSALEIDRLKARRAALGDALPASELAALDAALADLDANRHAAQEAPQEARTRLAELAERVQLASRQLEYLRPKLAEARHKQRRLLDLRALQELGARRDSLRSQIVQARFALAQLYDPAAEQAGRTE